MGSLKEVKGRIASVKSTQKITLAMKMVASAKLRKAQAAAEGANLYHDKLRSLLSRLVSAAPEVETPFVREKPTPGKTAIVVISSNTGMCGGFNANIAAALHQLIAERSKQGVMIFPVGKKIRDTVTRSGLEVHGDYDYLLNSHDNIAGAKKLTEQLVELFLSGEVAYVEILYHRFVTLSRQVITIERMLPFPAVEGSEQEGAMDSYILEPSPAELVASLIEQVIYDMIRTAVLSSYASEQRARTVAMQMASENAEEILTDLESEYNKLRQQGITSELLDIIGGSFA